MDFSTLTLEIFIGLISGTLGVLYGLGLRPKVVERLNLYIHERIEDEINSFVEGVEDNPEIVDRFVKLLRPYAEKELGRFLAKMGGTEEGMKDLKIAGVKIPAWAVQMGMQFLSRGKKHAQNELVDNALNIIDVDALK